MMRIINLGLVAHVDAGKTTLTEQLLYRAGALRTAGRVDDGTAQTDGLQVERERGISVRAASAMLTWEDVQINLIDTPGHVDFSGEVERSLTVLDAAVLVVSAVEGVQAQTQALLEVLGRLSMPCVVVINKIDRAGADSQAVREELVAVFEKSGRALWDVNTPHAEGEESCSVCLLSEDEQAEPLILACGDENLLDAYLSSEADFEQIEQAARKAVSQAAVSPVIYASSKLGVGVEDLLHTLCRFVVPRAYPGDEVSGRIFKVEHDPAMGKIAHVRLFSGHLKNRESVFLPRTGSEEKITQIRRVLGRRQIDLGELKAGDVAALCGLSGARAGDVLGRADVPWGDVHLTVPLLTVQILPDDPQKLMELVAAMNELADEDPLLHVDWIQEKQELHVSATGKIQLEVLRVLLLERYQLSVHLTEPSVIYKETPVHPGIGFDAYTMPKPCWAVVKFAIEPLPRGSGFKYDANVPNDKLFYRYQEHIKTAVPRALQQGIKGWEVTDLFVHLIDGEHHIVHTHPLDFFVATPMAIAKGLVDTETKLLEPILSLRLTGPEETLGKTVSLLVAARGVFDTPVVHGGLFTIEAEVPAAEALDLPTDFASMTGGRGVCGSRFLRYDDCPPGYGKTTPLRGVDPLDRSRFIMHARQVL